MSSRVLISMLRANPILAARLNPLVGRAVREVNIADEEREHGEDAVIVEEVLDICVLVTVVPVDVVLIIILRNEVMLAGVMLDRVEMDEVGIDNVMLDEVKLDEMMLDGVILDGVALDNVVLDDMVLVHKFEEVRTGKPLACTN